MGRGPWEPKAGGMRSAIGALGVLLRTGSRADAWAVGGTLNHSSHGVSPDGR